MSKSKSDAAYKKAFQNGPQPIAVFPNTPEGIAAAKNIIGNDAIKKAFSSGGGGASEIEANAKAAGYGGSNATIDRVSLLAALTVASRIVEKRTHIPILANVKVTGSRHGITVQGTDLDIECTVKVAGAKVTKPFSFTASAQDLVAVCRKAKADIVALTSDVHAASVLIGKFKASFNTLPVDDFPKMELPAEQVKFDMDSKDMLSALKHCVSSISNEETRYYLNGILFSVTDTKRFAMIATNGHRLAKKTVPMPKGSSKMPNVIVPTVMIHELIKALSAKDAPGKVFVTGYGEKPNNVTRMTFEVGAASYTSKMIDGTFPDYERVIPIGNTLSLKLDRKEAIEALESVSVFSQRGSAVRLSLNGATVFTTRNPDRGVTSMTIDGELKDIETGKSSQLDIGFDVAYLQSIFSEIADDEVEMRLADPGSPTIIRGTKSDGVHVLMPIRV